MDDREDQHVLARIIVIKQGLGDPRVAGDLRHRRLLHPLLGKHRRRAHQEPVLLFLEVARPRPRHLSLRLLRSPDAEREGRLRPSPTGVQRFLVLNSFLRPVVHHPLRLALGPLTPSGSCTSIFVETPTTLLI